MERNGRHQCNLARLNYEFDTEIRSTAMYQAMFCFHRLVLILCVCDLLNVFVPARCVRMSYSDQVF